MKKTTFILFFLYLFTCSQITAQNPKWFKKAAKAQITVVTMNDNGEILQSGSGFFIDENGTAVADYGLFKNSASAKVITSNGKEYEVDCILGANSLYDLVKFRTQTDKETPCIHISPLDGIKNENVYILPYPKKEKQVCLSDTLFDIQKFNGEYGYYTLGRPLDNQYLNSPVMNEEGEVIAMIQRKASSNTLRSYAISVAYASSLHTNGMSASDSDLNAIHIRKALPTDEDEARTFLFMIASRADSTLYQKYLNDYIQHFPKSSEAYTQRAEFFMAHGNYDAAANDVQEALKLSDKKDETCFSLSKYLYELNLRPDYKVYKDWNMNKALALAEEAYSINPLPLYIQQQGHILYALKEYDRAFERYMSLGKTNMRSANIFLYAAQCKRMTGADTLQILALQDSAVACFNKPYLKEAATALLERANTLISLERYRDAVMDLNEYERLMQSQLNAYFYYHREQAEMKCRMFQQAMNDIDQAIRMSPKEPLFHAERAVVYYRIGEFEEALVSARKSIELNPDFADAYRVAGICLIELKRRPEALTYLKKAAELGDETAKGIIEKEENNQAQ